LAAYVKQAVSIDAKCTGIVAEGIEQVKPTFRVEIAGISFFSQRQIEQQEARFRRRGSNGRSLTDETGTSK
jgi:hypothetical protein